MFEKAGRSVRLLSFRDDQPQERRGSLIPQSVKVAEKKRFEERTFSLVTTVALPIAAFALFAFVGISGYGLMTKNSQLASPTVTIMDPVTFAQVTLGYGPQATLSQDSFFSETRDAFIDQSQSFIEVDLDAKTLRLFEKGVLAQSTEIKAIGEEGSWWDAPSGLYKIEKKGEYDFSTIAQAYFPWMITFEGNYTIHGWPEYPGKKPVGDDFHSGGVRVDTKAAEAFFKAAQEGMPVLVHKKPKEEVTERFVYEPTVTGVTAPHYLIADINTGSVLAASDLEDAVPIASLTKLMTAVVAAEKMNLDSRIEITSPTFVQSLIPRLQDRTSVSMYSLLQLLLVESSNESAEVIAGEYGRDGFISEMNTKAKQVGMLSSKFIDPSGLGPENVSSLGDLFRLSQYIHNNRQFIFDITADGKIPTIEGFDEFANLSNFNQVKDVDNFEGGKVGETTAAGKTSISIHKVKIQGSDRTVIIILLGSAARTDDVHTLLKYVEEHFKS